MGSLAPSTHRDSVSGSEGGDPPEVFIRGAIGNHEQGRVCLAELVALVDERYPPVVVGQALKETGRRVQLSAPRPGLSSF